MIQAWRVARKAKKKKSEALLQEKEIFYTEGVPEKNKFISKISSAPPQIINGRPLSQLSLSSA